MASREVVKSLVHQLQYGNKEDATQKIRDLATDKNNHSTIAREGAIKPLIQILQNESDILKEKAVSAVCNLSFSPEIQVIIVNERGINPLIHLLITGTQISQNKAAATLWNLSFNQNYKILMANAGAILPLVQLLSGGSEISKEKAAGTLWNFSLDAENKIIIAKYGAIKPLILLLSSGSENLKEKAAALLWNLATNNDNQIIIGREGGIRPLINLLQNGSNGIKEKAAGALQNLSANNENINIMIKEGAIPVLVQVLMKGTQKAKEIAASALLKISAIEKERIVKEIQTTNISPSQIENSALKEFFIKYTKSSSSQSPPSPSSKISPTLENNNNNNNNVLTQSFEGLSLGQFEGEWICTIPDSSCLSLTVAGEEIKVINISEDVFPDQYQFVASQLNPIINNYTVQVLRMKNLAHQSMFHGSIYKCEKRLHSDLFRPQMESETHSSIRLQVLKRIEDHEALVQHNRDNRVKVMRVWHGTSVDKAKSITALGFANLATLDDGWFGKGIYFATSPEYALQYCRNEAEPCLMMCHVILLNPFPVIYDDAQSIDSLRFAGKPNYKNYESHFIPVVQYGKYDFRPPQPGQKASWDEIVMFQESHILVHSLVVLKKKQ